MNGSAQCQRCKSEVALDNLRNGLCDICRDEIRARNAGKPKPRGKNIKKNALGWVERKETVRPADTNVSELLAAASNKVSETERKPYANGPEKSATIDGNKVSGTASASIDNDNPNKIASKSLKVSETGNKVSETQDWQEHIAESLMTALRRIKVLEEKIEQLAPLIEKEESKRDSEGMKRLRDELFNLLRKGSTKGIPVSSLYGPNGRKGGKLSISKAQAFRLRDACRMDDRFRVMRAENQSAKWIIILNQHIK
jgi:hypothetical protein